MLSYTMLERKKYIYIHMYKHTHMHAVYVKINKPNINNMGYTW